MMTWVPAKSLLLGVPYYGYDWPVTSDVPNATVQSDKTKYGAVKSVTYASARAFLASHPAVVRNYDSLEGSGFYTYWDSTHATFRQVYFEEERSLTAKYDYAIATGLGGIGIWTLDNDRGYDALANVLRAKFYAPVYQATVTGSVTDVVRRSGVVYVKVHAGARNTGTVPLKGHCAGRSGIDLVGWSSVGAGRSRCCTQAAGHRAPRRCGWVSPRGFRRGRTSSGSAT